jgi:acetylornithine deacetylase/succinyl-diaminopimelate desuccinylase-like protein
VPGIVMGPGRPERSHQADEFIRITEVLDAIAIYASTANAWWSRVRA